MTVPQKIVDLANSVAAKATDLRTTARALVDAIAAENATPAPAPTPTPTPTPPSGQVNPDPPEVQGLPPADYPWPNATNTGHKGTPAPYSGPMTISTVQTIEGKHIKGNIVFTVAGCTLKNCLIEGTGFFIVDMAKGGTIQDCTIKGGGAAQTGKGACINGRGMFLRNNLFNHENAINVTAGGTTIRGNYIHGLVSGGTDPHYDGIQVQGGQDGVLIERNRIMARDTSCIICQTYFGPVSNVVVRQNYMGKDGSFLGFVIYMEDKGNGPQQGCRVEYNVMERGQYGYFYMPFNAAILGNVDALNRKPIDLSNKFPV